MKFNDWLFIEEFRNDIFKKELINYHITEIFKQVISETLKTRGFLEEKLYLENEEDEEEIQLDDPFSGSEDAKPVPEKPKERGEEEKVINYMKSLKDAMLLYYWKINPTKAEKIPGLDSILSRKSEEELRNEIAELLFKVYKTYAARLTNEQEFERLGFEWTDAVSLLYENLIKIIEQRGLEGLGENLSDLDIDDALTLNSLKSLGKRVMKNALRFKKQNSLKLKVKQQNYKTVLINFDLSSGDFSFYKTYYTTGNLINLPSDDDFSYGGRKATIDKKRRAAIRYRKEIADSIKELSLVNSKLYPIENPTDENIKTSLLNYIKTFGFTQREVPMSTLSSAGSRGGEDERDDFEASIEASLRRPGSYSDRDPLGVAATESGISRELADSIRAVFSSLFARERKWALTMCIALGLDCSSNELPSGKFEISPLYKVIKTGVSPKFDLNVIIEKLKGYGIIANKQNVTTWLMNARNFLQEKLK